MAHVVLDCVVFDAPLLLCIQYTKSRYLKCSSLDTPENQRRQQQWQVADCSLPAGHFYLCKTLQPFLVVVALALSVVFGRIWHCHSRDADITTKCKVMENQSWEEAVVKRTSPVAVVALFHVLWVFLDTTPISRTGGRIKHSSVVLSDMVNEKVKQRNMVVNRACESHQQNIKPQLLSRLELVYVLD